MIGCLCIGGDSVVRADVTENSHQQESPMSVHCHAMAANQWKHLRNNNTFSFQKSNRLELFQIPFGGKNSVERRCLQRDFGDETPDS